MLMLQSSARSLGAESGSMGGFVGNMMENAEVAKVFRRRSCESERRLCKVLENAFKFERI